MLSLTQKFTVYTMSDLPNYTVKAKDSITSAVTNISSSGLRISCVVDKVGKLEGVITDGDIRRFIISGGSLDEPCSKIMNRSPYTVKLPYKRELEVEKLQNKDLTAAPIVDDKGILLGVLKALGKSSYDVPVLIMAGGFGTRLGALTKETPKPMVLSNGKPMLEHILNRLKACGFHNFLISVHYLKEQIMSYFGDGSNFGVSIEYLIEEVALGTGGSLTLLNEKQKGPLIICNGDIITDIDFSKFYDFYVSNGSRAAICLHSHQYKIPYGVAELDGDRLVSLQEKPDRLILINSGIYCIDMELIKLIPKNQFIHMPDILRLLQNDKIDVTAYVSDKSWIDFGKPMDLETTKKLTF